MKKKVRIYKILRTTPGQFHSWLDSNVGIIRKPNGSINLGHPFICKVRNFLKDLIP